MSLVIAFVGSQGSVMGGDMREITLWGDPSGSEQLEEELYAGRIRSDEEMRAQAQNRGVHLRIWDSKKKVRESEGILIGEVTDFERGITRIRRLYVTVGRYALVDIENHQFDRIQRGEASRFIVLGNPFTQEITLQCIQQHWKGGGVTEAARLIERALTFAADKSASVSKEHLLVRTDTRLDLEPILERDQAEKD